MELNTGLLDLVPWQYGFAHSFALRWLLQQPTLGSSVLAALEDFPLDADGEISCVRVEPKGGRGRADVGFWLTDHDGKRHRVFIEVKVNDHLTPAQMDAYDGTAVLYAPGLTGLFTATGALTVSGAKLTSQALVSALAPFQSQLPPLMRGYVCAVDSERERLETARCVVHGRFTIAP